MEFVRSDAVEVHESQATFNVCVVKHGENSCPVTALVTTCSGSSDPAATGKGGEGVDGGRGRDGKEGSDGGRCGE